MFMVQIDHLCTFSLIFISPPSCFENFFHAQRDTSVGAPQLVLDSASWDLQAVSQRITPPSYLVEGLYLLKPPPLPPRWPVPLPLPPRRPTMGWTVLLHMPPRWRTVPGQKTRHYRRFDASTTSSKCLETTNTDESAPMTNYPPTCATTMNCAPTNDETVTTAVPPTTTSTTLLVENVGNFTCA